MSLSGGLDPVAFYEEVATHRGSTVLWNGAWRGDAVNGSDAGTVPAAARSAAMEALEALLCGGAGVRLAGGAHAAHQDGDELAERLV